jgi:TetR/AcrR family transcriptional repressor of nem operon
MTKGEQTRRRIVAAAAPIFNQHGYEGSSLNDLMQATGLKKGGIYRHFSSKEALAVEAFDYTWEAAWNARILHVHEKAKGCDRHGRRQPCPARACREGPSILDDPLADDREANQGTR